MHAQQHLAVSVHNQLANAVAALHLGQVAAGKTHGNVDGLGREAGLLGRLQGVAHAGHLGVCVDDRGDGLVAHAVLYAQHVGHGHLAFAVGGVGQHAFAVDIACRPDAGHIGAHFFVGEDGAALGGNAQALQPQALAGGPPANGKQHLFGLHALALAVLFKRDPAAFHTRHLAAQQEGDAALFEVFLQNGADFRIGGPGNLVQHLHHGHLCANVAEISGHLQADDPAANHHQGGRGLGEGQNFTVGQHQAAFQPLLHTGNGGRDRHRPGGHQQLLGGIAFLARLHQEAVAFLAFEAGLCADDRHLVVFQLRGHAGHQHFHHFVLPFYHLGMVNLGVFCRHPVFVSVQGILVDFGGVQKGLGGDAALVQAHAAQRAFFHQGGFQPATGRALCRQVTGRAAAKNQ